MIRTVDLTCGVSELSLVAYSIDYSVVSTCSSSEKGIVSLFATSVLTCIFDNYTPLLVVIALVYFLGLILLLLGKVSGALLVIENVICLI